MRRLTGHCRIKLAMLSDSELSSVNEGHQSATLPTQPLTQLAVGFTALALTLALALRSACKRSFFFCAAIAALARSAAVALAFAISWRRPFKCSSH